MKLIEAARVPFFESYMESERRHLPSPSPPPGPGSVGFEGAELVGRLRALELTIEPGERVAIVGPNGAGKSSLLRLAMGLETPSRGSVWLGGQALSKLTPKERARFISWLPQRLPMSGDFRALDLVAASRYARGETTHTSERLAQAALREVSAAELAERRADTLSGGELQRVMLAALIVQDTPVVCADEPGNHLDPYQQLLIYRRLRRLGDLGKTLLVVTHDVALLSLLGPLEKVRVVVLRAGALYRDLRGDDATLPGALSELFGVEILRGSGGDLEVHYPREVP